MKNNEILEIVGLGSNGDGYYIATDHKVFIPFTVPGDKVAINEGKRVIKPSNERMQPPCQHFGSCGGRRLQHLSPLLYQAFKKDQILNSLKAHKVSFEHMDEPIILGSHQRRRVTLKAQKLKTGVKLGYYQSASHLIVDVIKCPLVVSEIENFIKPLKDFLSKFLIAQEKAEIAITSTIPGLDVWLKIASQKNLSLNQREALSTFAQQNKVARLSLNDELIAIFETPFVKFAGIQVSADSKSFLQASKASDQLLETLIDKYILFKNKKSVIADLFCGRGTLTFPLLKHGPVHAFEMEEEALGALKKAAAQVVLSYPLKTHYRNLFQEPLTAAELEIYEVVTLDPPRVGAAAQVKELAQSTVEQIIYVSCNPQTFAHDAAILTAGSYILERMIPIDQFHWSVHVEIFAIFKKI